MTRQELQQAINSYNVSISDLGYDFSKSPLELDRRKTWNLADMVIDAMKIYDKYDRHYPLFTESLASELTALKTFIRDYSYILDYVSATEAH